MKKYKVNYTIYNGDNWSHSDHNTFIYAENIEKANEIAKEKFSGYNSSYDELDINYIIEVDEEDIIKE